LTLFYDLQHLSFECSRCLIKELAINMLMININKKWKQSYKKGEYMRLCTFCSKPMKKKGHLCGSCVSMINKINQYREKIPKNGKMKKDAPYKISQRKVKFLIDHVIKSYDSDIVLRWFNGLHYHDWFTFIPGNSRVASQYKKNIRATNREYVSMDIKIPKDVHISVELPYIPIEFQKNNSFQSRIIEGERDICSSNHNC